MAASVDGLVSGLDTSGIISQLMQLERLPVTRLEQKKTAATAVTAAYQSLNNRFATLQSAAGKLTQSDFWQGRKATSSSTEVAVSASPSALAGSFTFDVEQVAAAQSYISTATYASTSAPATSATTMTIAKNGGAPVAVDVGDGSLGALVIGINKANAGVRAAAAQVAPGVYRLQLASTTTGADTDFALVADGLPYAGLDELAAGRDARIAVGELLAPGRYTITSPTNTLTDVMPGVTLTVKSPVNGVTVDVAADPAAISAQIETMVGAANALLGDIKTMTAYNTATNKGGVLLGDSTARGLQQEVLRLVASTSGSAGAAGVGLDKTGALTFDKSKFAAAYAADPVAVERMFRPHGTTTEPVGGSASLAATVSLFSADDRTVAGNYGVVVTQAATRASATVTGVPTAGDTVTISVPGKTAAVVTATTADPSDLAELINQRSAQDGLGVVALVDGANVVVRMTAYGSAPTFTLAAGGGLAAGATTAGLDVDGTIGGVNASGVGQVLSVPADTPGLRGLSLLVTADAAQVAAAAAQGPGIEGLLGSFAYTPGLAQRLDSLAGDAIRSADGRLTTAIAGRNKQVESIDDEIASWDTRLILRERALRRQYSNLEVALGKLREQSSWLSAQVGSLSANNGG